jgi:hypothetical protein
MWLIIRIGEPFLPGMNLPAIATAAEMKNFVASLPRLVAEPRKSSSTT